MHAQREKEKEGKKPMSNNTKKLMHYLSVKVFQKSKKLFKKHQGMNPTNYCFNL